MFKTTHLAAALFVALGLALGAARAAAADGEVREFTVRVDGKPAGSYTMTFTPKDDGSTSVACQADVKVKVLGVVAYAYHYEGTEVWKDGRLQSLQSTCNDDGKKFTVSAAADEKGMRVKINGQEKTVRGDAYLTSACVLPDEKRRDGALPLMEADNGKEIDGKFQPVGSATLTVGGQSVKCGHYRLTSGSAHDLWYDGSDRMVRQEWTEDGHKTVLELARIRR